jgi:hypothetical protein
VLEKIILVIPAMNKYFVKLGFNEQGYETSASYANMRKFYEKGWQNLVLDARYESAKIILEKHYLFTTNIATIFEENMVAKDLNYLSCDIDSRDL